MGSRLEQKSTEVRKRIEAHEFKGENGEEYGASAFGGFTDYFRRKKIKLQNLDAELREQSADKPQIFRGVVCHVNGYTQPSLNDLHVMIVQHGGGFLQYLDGKTMVTHIIASNLTPKKKEEFKRYRIVKPAWVVDSIQAGKLLPWNAYKVVDEGVAQKVLAADGGKMISQARQATQGYKEQSEGSWYTKELARGAHEDGGAVEADEVEAEMALDDAVSDDGLDHEAANADNSKLRARQGAQEPDYSMAVVRDSEALQSVSPSRLAAMTAEEYNSLLLSDPKIRKSTVVNPDFLEQYYRESRLHHLSTWKADLKTQLQALASEQTSAKRSRMKKLPGQRRYILHVDFDSFFCAVSLKKHPQYVDKPCVVAHGGGSGSEIASCNYPARKFGVSNGMWMRRAQEMCPDLKILPYDFPAYEDASRKFYNAILATDGVVKSVSIDEALVDVSAICFAESGSDGVGRAEGSVHREQSKADHVAQALREEVLAKTGCNVSVGIGGNILLAKVALRKAKPAGQYHLKPEDVLDFIGHLEVQNLPGVAWSIGGKLEEIGVKLVKDIREVTRERLTNALGPKTGEKLWEFARGIDKTEVGQTVIRKSVSAEVNWGVRFENQEQVDEFMQGLCGELNKRLLKEGVKGKQLTVKVMKRAEDAPRCPPKHLGHGKCDTFNKSLQLGVATNDAGVLAKESTMMLKSLGIAPGELRGIGVQMQKLVTVQEEGQGRLLFGMGGASREASSSALINTAGTQFVLPTQVDPSVLAELPEDIRSKLSKAKASMPVKRDDVALPKQLQMSVKHEDVAMSTRQMPVRRDDFALPTHSQIDPSILEALPEDVRAELLDYYKPKAAVSSPRKPKAQPPPPKRKTLFKAKPKLGETLTQANFVAVGTDNEAEMDPEVLAALPEDIRAEILAEKRRQRTGLEVTRPRALQRKVDKVQAERVLPVAITTTPTFTSRKLSALPDLREAVEAWFAEFAEEGPYEEDTRALTKYLSAVVLEERDVAKAVAVVNWLTWTTREASSWEETVREVREVVDHAGRERGLAGVVFD